MQVAIKKSWNDTVLIAPTAVSTPDGMYGRTRPARIRPNPFWLLNASIGVSSQALILLQPYCSPAYQKWRAKRKQQAAPNSGPGSRRPFWTRTSCPPIFT